VEGAQLWAGTVNVRLATVKRRPLLLDDRLYNTVSQAKYHGSFLPAKSNDVPMAEQAKSSTQAAAAPVFNHILRVCGVAHLVSRQTQSCPGSDLPGAWKIRLEVVLQ
jgi:hypothetical protein